MRDRGMSALGALACALALALGGCMQPPEVRAEEVCDALCACNAALTPNPAQCTSSCVTQLAPVAISDSCLDCLDEPLCTTRTSCLVACLPVQGGNP